VPAEKIGKHCADCNIEHIFGGRCRAFKKQGQNGNLQRVRGKGQNHRGAQPGFGRDRDGRVRHIESA